MTKDKTKVTPTEFVISYFEMNEITVNAAGCLKFKEENTSSDDEQFLKNSVSRMKKREDTIFDDIYVKASEAGLFITQSLLRSAYKNVINKLSAEALKKEVGWIFIGQEQDQNKRIEFFQNIAKIICENKDEAEIFGLILLKTIGQIKTKILYGSASVHNHIMPIFYGNQGCGKSTFCRSLMSGLGSAFSEGTIKELEDKKAYTKFSDSYVMFFDEMQKADKTDVNAIKNAVTSTEFHVRPMGTNKNVILPNNLTFIGTTNVPVDTLIRDETGNRRFVQLDYGSRTFGAPYLDPRYKNIDFRQLWLMAIADDDKIFKKLEKEAELKKFIEKKSYREPVLHFILEDANFKMASDESKTAKAVFDEYKNWCDQSNIKEQLQFMTFSKKLRKYIVDDNANPNVEHFIKNNQSHYRVKKTSV